LRIGQAFDQQFDLVKIESRDLYAEICAAVRKCTGEAAELFGCGGAKVYRVNGSPLVCMSTDQREAGCTAWRFINAYGVLVTLTV